MLVFDLVGNCSESGAGLSRDVTLFPVQNPFSCAEQSLEIASLSSICAIRNVLVAEKEKLGRSPYTLINSKSVFNFLCSHSLGKWRDTGKQTGKRAKCPGLGPIRYTVCVSFRRSCCPVAGNSKLGKTETHPVQEELSLTGTGHGKLVLLAHTQNQTRVLVVRFFPKN